MAQNGIERMLGGSPGAVLAKLHEPGPHAFRRRVDRDRMLNLEGPVARFPIAGQRHCELGSCASPGPVPRPKRGGNCDIPDEQESAGNAD